MALTMKPDLVPINAVRVIAAADDALDPASDWEGYKEAFDEAKLKFLPGKAPTLFICNFQFDARSSRMVNNSMLSAKDDSGKPSLSYGTWAQTVAKVSLKDIQNPPYVTPEEAITLRKDANGLVHDDLLAKLEKFGVIDDIFNAFILLQKKKAGPAETKNL